jgi:hypothetical protein
MHGIGSINVFCLVLDKKEIEKRNRNNSHNFIRTEVIYDIRRNMTRTLKIVVVLMLVMGNICFLQTIDQTNSFVASAEETPLSWEQLNQTMAMVILYIDNRLDNMTTELKEYIDQKMTFNLTDGNATINLNYNNTELMNLIENESEYFKSILGNFNESVTVYNQLASILNGLTDNEGKYILKDETGKSMFKIVIANQEILSQNQDGIVTIITMSHNGTRTITEATHNSLYGRLDDMEKNILGSSGDGLFSILAGIGIAFLIVWIFILKPKMKRNYEMQQQAQTQNYPGQRMNIVESLKSRNPFKMHPVAQNELPPDCYKDGRSYDPYTEAACNACPHARDCEDEKLNVEANREIQLRKQQEDEEKQKKISPIGNVYDLSGLGKKILNGDGKPQSSLDF